MPEGVKSLRLSASNTNLECEDIMHKPTIWEALAEKLGREPTHDEACDEVKRILAEAREERLGSQRRVGR